MATNIKPEDVAHLKEAFASIDSEKTGKIPVKYVERVLDKSGFSVSTSELKLLLLRSKDFLEKGQDKYSEMRIDFDTLVKQVSDLSFNMKKDPSDLIDEGEQFREAFYVLSESTGGYFVSREKLKQMMHSLDSLMTDMDLDEMMKEADHDLDGKINYRDFITILSTLDD